MNTKSLTTAILTRTIRRVGIVRTVIFTLIAAMTALACAWSSIDDHSVRFNYERTGRGFYRLPPLPIFVDPGTGKEFSTREVENYLEADLDDPDAQKKVEQDRESIYDEARDAVEAGNLSDAKQRLEKYLEVTRLPTDYYETSDDLQAATAIPLPIYLTHFLLSRKGLLRPLSRLI